VVLVRILLSPQQNNKPLTIPVERFMSMLRFDSKGKLGDLEIDMDYLSSLKKK